MLLCGDNGILKNTQLSSSAYRFSHYKEELEMSTIDDNGVSASGEAMKQYVKSMKDEDLDNFVILNSKFLYIGENELEKEAAVISKIETASGAVSEIKAIISYVIDLGKNNSLPANDMVGSNVENKNTKNGLIGKRLYDKNENNRDNWDIVVEYNVNNQKIAEYGSGYYLLHKGETYIIGDETIKFENNYIIDYNKNEFIGLSLRAINWNLKTTLAVTDGLVLNIDPTNLAERSLGGARRNRIF